MKFCFTLLLLLLFVFAPAATQKKKAASDPCAGNTQFEMNKCAAREYQRADAELNDVYRQLLKTVENDKLATTKIKWAEQTWIVYRDAYLEAMYPEKDKQTNYGSIFPMEYAEFKTKLTRQQMEALKDLLRAHSPDGASAGR